MSRKCTYKKVILIDWLRFSIDFDEISKYGLSDDEDISFLDSDILSRVKYLLGISDSSEFVNSFGLYGYTKGYILGGLRVCWGGNRGTLMVDISGEGCRLLETLNEGNEEFDWLTLICFITSFSQYNFSRMDVACDTYDLLHIQTIFNYVMQNRYIQLWNVKPLIRWGREETILFGSETSNVLLRIYNKTYERECKSGAVPEEIPPNWVRCEFELSDKAVDSFIREWVSGGDISAVYFGLMISHLRFVKERAANLTRDSITVSWWNRFIDNNEPMKLAYKGGLEYNLQSLERYVFGQAGSSINAFLRISGGDVSELISRVEQIQFNSNQSALISTVEALKNSDFGCGCIESIASKIDFEEYMRGCL